MAIDAELILRQARDLQRLDLDPARANELAEELRSLVEDAFVVSAAVPFEDDPGRFVGTLWELRDTGWDEP